MRGEKKRDPPNKQNEPIIVPCSKLIFYADYDLFIYLSKPRGQHCDPKVTIIQRRKEKLFLSLQS